VTDDRRMTTEELIDRVWAILCYREYERSRRDDLPDKCPPDVRLILEAVDEIAKWRAEEATRSNKGRRASPRKKKAGPKLKPKPRPTDDQIKNAYRDKVPLMWRGRRWLIESWVSAGDPPQLTGITLIELIDADEGRQRPKRKTLSPASFAGLESAD
jgi:hypothetical protein